METIFDLITSFTPNLTRSEKKVARVVLAEYPSAGLLTVAELAKQSKVSGQTVIRLATKLGFDGYPAFQACLIEELKTRTDSPLTMYERRQRGLLGSELLKSGLSKFNNSLEETFAELPVSEFKDAIDLIADPKKNILTTGGRFSEVLADYLYRHLHQIRPKTAFLPSKAALLTDHLIDISSKTVLVCFDFRRYQESTIAFANAAYKCGAKIILITDPYLSPVSHVSTVVLPTNVAVMPPFDSQISGLALVEILIAGLVEKLEDTCRKRIEKIEKFRNLQNESQLPKN